MDKKNFSECGIIQDLLPLYYDDVCTPASKELVQRHLEHCVACRALYEELEDHSVDCVIEAESRQVLERHARKERTAAWKAGLIISVLLLVPVILTLLFSIAVGGGLGVFSVTTASMLLVAALTAVPLMTEQKKLTKSILAGIFALLLILFFVDRMNGGGQFLLLAIPTIFGLSVPLFPFVIRGLALPPVLSDKKALLTMVWDTAWLFLYHLHGLPSLRGRGGAACRHPHQRDPDDRRVARLPDRQIPPCQPLDQGRTDLPDHRDLGGIFQRRLRADRGA